jgi:hypothetical protein
MCNTHNSGTKLLILNVRRSIEALRVREGMLLKTLQANCKHSEVAEYDRGSNNHSVRICKECTLKEEVWVDEAGMASGYDKLVGAEGRLIKPVASVFELDQYQTLE